MNEDIMEIANTLVYSHRLRCGTSAVATAALALDLGKLPPPLTGDVNSGWLWRSLVRSQGVVFLDTDAVPAREQLNNEVVSNPTEAAIVKLLVHGLLQAAVSSSSIAIITPFRAQLQLLRESTRRWGVEASTVDRFQGRDKDCVIVCFTRSNVANDPGKLLRDWRRLNVSVTRAKKKLFFVGSCSTLRGCAALAALLDLVEEKGWGMALPVGAHLTYPCRDPYS